MPVLTLTGESQTLTYEVTAGSEAPTEAYARWASEIGVSSTETLQAMNGDDEIYTVALGAPIFNGWAAQTVFASEAGLSFHKNIPASTARTQYTIANVSRMYGTATRPKLLFTFHPQSDLQSLATKVQRSGTVTIIFAAFSKYDNQSQYRYDAAIRIDVGEMRFVGRAYDAFCNLYFNEFEESTTQTLIAQTLAFSQDAGTTINLDAFASVVANAEIPGILSDPSALGYYGALDRVGTISLGGILGGLEQIEGRVYAAGYGASPTPLGQVQADAINVPVGFAGLPSIMGADQSTARVYAAGYGSAPSVLSQSVLSRAVHDYSAQIGRTDSRYLVNLITPDGEVRVPISSWQATLQLDALNYVQCVVPAAGDHVAAINAATEFVVLRTAVSDGVSLTQEMARTQITQSRFDRGPYKYTCTLSGYSPGFVQDEQPDITNRTLENIRSITSGQGGLRARCAVDWLLRPGQRASIEGALVTVAYINYYVGQGDAYMDVGERVA